MLVLGCMLSVWAVVFVFVFLLVCLLVCFFICLVVCLFVCLKVLLNICLFVPLDGYALVYEDSFVFNALQGIFLHVMMQLF